jgi:hypothetical protein
MPLSDYFRGRDPLVQQGVISRPQNWQMRLGSLAAAFGNMDRGGMLGQTLAQAGAIYQDQRQGALAAALERAQNEAKQTREDELFAMQRDRYEAERADREIQEEERRVKVEQEVQGREAMRRRLDDLGLPMQYADNPDVAQSAINEAEVARRPEKPQEPQTYHMGEGGGSLVTMGPDGQWHQQVFPGQPKQLTPQEDFLRTRGYNPADPLANERYMRDQGFIKGEDGGLTTKGKLELTTKIAGELIEASADPITGETSLTYDMALERARQTVSGLVKSFEMDRAPKEVRGSEIAGIQIPKKPGMSSSASGGMKVIRTSQFGKLDDSDASALLKIQQAIESIPDQQMRAQAMALAMQENKQGKSWAMLWAEMNAQ